MNVATPPQHNRVPNAGPVEYSVLSAKELQPKAPVTQSVQTVAKCRQVSPPAPGRREEDRPSTPEPDAATFSCLLAARETPMDIPLA